VVDHGQIIAQGTPAGLKAGLGSTVIEIGMPGEGSALMALQALAPLGVQPPTLDGTTVKLTVADGGSILLEALRVLDTEGIAPTGVTLREPSLDDVFLSLTGHAAVESSGDGDDPALRGAA
jgi:ABC-2 type transport system ATP-binding protein